MQIAVNDFVISQITRARKQPVCVQVSPHAGPGFTEEGPGAMGAVLRLRNDGIIHRAQETNTFLITSKYCHNLPQRWGKDS